MFLCKTLSLLTVLLLGASSAYAQVGPPVAPANPLPRTEWETNAFYYELMATLECTEDLDTDYCWFYAECLDPTTGLIHTFSFSTEDNPSCRFQRLYEEDLERISQEGRESTVIRP